MAEKLSAAPSLVDASSPDLGERSQSADLHLQESVRFGLFG
jgi:hypothetical protein